MTFFFLQMTQIFKKVGGGDALKTEMARDIFVYF